MANPEHLAILKQGVAVWEQWRIENQRGVVPDLRYADLSSKRLAGAYLDDVNLYKADLSGADLHGAKIRRTVLGGANLAFANMTGADLGGSHLGRVNLNGASLVGARVRGVNLYRAELIETDFTNAELAWTVFSDTDLSSAKGLETVHHFGPSAIGTETLIRSIANVPEVFFRGAGIAAEVLTFAQSLVTRPIQFYSCFISYSHADLVFARWLHDTLEANGIRCWLDEKQLLPGDDIHDQVDRGIRLWDKVLLCCSEHSLKPGSWVDKEIVTALEKEEERTRHRGQTVRVLIPLNLDGYLFSDGWNSGYRAVIRGRLAANFTGWKADMTKSFEAQVKNVITALRADQGARERPPASLL